MHGYLLCSFPTHGLKFTIFLLKESCLFGKFSRLILYVPVYFKWKLFFLFNSVYDYSIIPISTHKAIFWKQRTNRHMLLSRKMYRHF